MPLITRLQKIAENIIWQSGYKFKTHHAKTTNSFYIDVQGIPGFQVRVSDHPEPVGGGFNKATHSLFGYATVDIWIGRDKTIFVRTHFRNKEQAKHIRLINNLLALNNLNLLDLSASYRVQDLRKAA